MAAKSCPSESYEAVRFVEWLEQADPPILFSHIPSGMFSRSWKTIAKNKREGLRRGLPDYLLILPNNKLIFVEMKRLKGGRVSPEQKIFIEALTRCDIEARVCLGAEEAINFVKEMMGL